MSTLLQRIAAQQKRWCLAFDRLLPDRYQVNGYGHFKERVLPRYIKSGMRVYDVGGGSRPYVSPQMKADLGLTVIGLDIDPDELAKAPGGIYDETISADLTRYSGRGDADLVICQAVLEHVDYTAMAIRGLATIVKPGGHIAMFVPSRHAVFARLNMILPEAWKRALLARVLGRDEHSGFRAHYDQCTPADMKRLLVAYGLTIEHEVLYYQSNYFTALFPLYVLWRAWILAFHAMAGAQAAETFVLVATKRPERLPC